MISANDPVNGGLAARLAWQHPVVGATGSAVFGLRRELPMLITERLILRAPRSTDFERFADIACSARGRLLGGPMDREAAWQSFMQMTSNWVLQERALWTIGYAGDIAGFAVLGVAPEKQDRELGVALVAHAQGNGIARETARAVTAHAFDSLGWTSLVSHIEPGNFRAQSLARQLGAVNAGQNAGTEVWRVSKETLAA